MLTCPILTTGGYGAVIECQGMKVLSNTGNGWSYEMTPAELTKRISFTQFIGQSTVLLKIIQGQNFQNCRIIWKIGLFLIKGRNRK